MNIVNKPDEVQCYNTVMDRQWREKEQDGLREEMEENEDDSEAEQPGTPAYWLLLIRFREQW